MAKYLLHFFEIAVYYHYENDLGHMLEARMKKTSVTIRDVSTRCGLSVSTVSKALNGYADISEETRSLVLRTAGEIGYYPSAVARTLKTNRSYNLGVLFEEESGQGLTHYFFASILDAFKSESEKRGYDITFINRNSGGRGMSYLEHCRYRNVDGVCVVCAGYDDPGVHELVHSGLPCVTIDLTFDCCSCVANQNSEGVEALVRYAAQLGHKRIAFIHGRPSQVTQERVQGWRHALKVLGLDEPPEEYQQTAAYVHPPSAYEAMKRLMNLPVPPTCVLAPDDYAALGVLNATEELGLKVPQDVSVAGYDGIRLTQMLLPRMTTIRQPTEQIGQQAASELINQVESAKPLPPRVISIPGTLIEGESIGPARK